MEGQVPTGLLNGTGITTFLAKNTSLTGYLPRIGSSLVIFDLSSTKLNLCDQFSLDSINGYAYTCLVGSSDASYCASSYVQCGTSITCPPPGFLPPFESPPTSTPEVAQTPVPIAAPINPTPPSECPLSTSPGPEFTCIGGRWTAAAVTAPALIIPPGAGTVVVLGDVESSEVVINDLSSSVNINGCAGNLSTVTLQLTKEQIEKIGSGTVTQPLISTSSTGCSNLNSVNLNTQVSNQGCKKLKTTKQVSPDGSSLSAVFSLQTSSCNTWWIILVSVVCGVIVIGLIIIIVSVVCCSCCKRKVRPFAGTDGHHTV